MLSLHEIKAFYPNDLQGYERFILREYLQHVILEIVFESEYANKLAFLGGTCLRVVYGNQRFSEDLDFDHFSLTGKDFSLLSKQIQTKLNQQGFDTEMREVHKGAFHCYIKFPGILFASGLSGHREERILIQLDSEAHGFGYEPDQIFLNRFGIFTQVHTTPKDILLAQKFYAVLNRKRNKGRDFLDIVFLLGMNVRPNYDYLKLKVDIENADVLRTSVLQHCDSLNMEAMAKDVAPFLFHKNHQKKVQLFPEFIAQAAL